MKNHALSDARPDLPRRFWKLRHEVLSPPDFCIEASPEPFGLKFEVTDLGQQLIFGRLVVLDRRHWKSRSAFMRTSSA